MKLPKLSRGARIALIIAGAVLGIGILAVVNPGGVSPFFINLGYSDCKNDSEIATDKQDDLQRAGLAFVQSLLAEDVDGGLALMDADARKALKRDSFKAMVEQIRQLGPYDNVQVSRLYLVDQVGFGLTPSRTTCARSMGSEDRVTVVTTPIAEQAYIIVDADTKTNSWAFVLWVDPDDGWRVRHFQFQVTAIAGRDAEAIWALAREQRDRGHKFNAAFLYLVAAQFASRGPNFELGILPEIQAERAKQQVPDQLQGNLPLLWQGESGPFKIMKISLTAIGAKLYLELTQEVARWNGDDEADQQNRKLLAWFKQTFPEYADVFGGIVAVAVNSGGGDSHRTVDPPEPTN